MRDVLLFDIETDGLLDELTRVHVLCVKDPATGERWTFRHNDAEDTIPAGLALLDTARLVVAHNGIRFDLPALAKTHGFERGHAGSRDTMVLTQLLWPELASQDVAFRAKPRGRSFPGNLTGRHSLEAWGHRLGLHKGEYRGDPSIPDEKERLARRWERWNQSMEDYCVQDVEVLDALWKKILSKEHSEESFAIETQVAWIIARQERHGFLFDEAAAVRLYGRLSARRAELEQEVRAVFRPRFLPDGPAGGAFTPKRDNAKAGYVEGAPLTKVKLAEFNPGSRQHVSTWLIRDLGWEPTEFTGDGHPKVDEEVISRLPYPSAKPLKEYFMVLKRLGQIAEGDEAWLKKVKKDGRMRGRVNTNGAATRRMAHSGPNMAQVPAAHSPYGPECRALFIVPEGKALVGIDADALELRDLAGFMARFDGGAYVQTVLSGDKAKGTDMHSVNCRALGMDPKARPFEAGGDPTTGRDIAKTWFYAFIYGAGDEKLGTILTKKRGKAAARRGAQARADFLRNLPAMGKLVDAVKRTAKERGHLYALDKAVLPVRSPHAALNTLLQSAGAVQMKKALCLFDDALQARGWVPGKHYEFVANVHDEWQLEVDDEIAQDVGRMGADAIRLAGEAFGFRCPLAGAYGVGRSWADTH